MILFVYKTSVGLFKIVLSHSGKWNLFANDKNLGAYDSIIAAVDQVYLKTTGWNEWDSIKEEGPLDIYEWQPVRI